MRTFFLLSALVLLAQSAQLQAQHLDYLWPTNASRHLTSTFGETRSAHFHSGLDIKTWGREGYEVYAAADGIVYRLGTSVRGYGKVIYLRHADSTFTVYAHLQRFNDELQSVIDKARLTDYRYEADIQIDTLGIWVKRGDVIGITGSSGIGPPHLHFETRTKENVPFNALTTNLRIRDTIHPTIPALQAMPLSPETRIYGNPFPQLLYLNDGHFGTVEANGPFGFAVSTSDGADQVSNRYAVYSLSLSTGKDTLFHEELTRFSFDEAGLMMQDRKAARGASRRSYQVLYPQDGPRIPFYQLSSPGSVIHPTDSLKRYTITASDYYGNTTRATVDVLRREYPSGRKRQPGLSVFLREGHWTNDWIALGDQVIDLTDRIPDGTVIIDSVTHLLDHREERFLLKRIEPGKTATVWSLDAGIRLRMPAESIFDTLTVAITESRYEGLPYLQVLPQQAAVQREAEISYYLPDSFYEPNSSYYLFRLDRGRNRITPVDSRQQGRTVIGYPSSLGEFLVMKDNKPPVLKDPMIYQMSHGQWFVRVSAGDEGSGVDHESAVMEVNGKRGIAEYDYEEGLLIYYLPGFDPETTNQLEVTVSDRAGNRTSRIFKLGSGYQR